MKINRNEFSNLDFDEKCAIIEQLLTDDYFNGQHEINFWVPENFKGEIGESLPETPPEIKAIEHAKFKNLIDELTLKLFSKSDEIEYVEDKT